MQAIYEPEPKVRDFYLHALELMDRSEIRYVVGGGYAMARYTGIIRHTKDLDLFILPRDRDATLEVFRSGGYRTELTWPHFLVKALCGDSFVDVLFSSANGLCPVDELFFEYAVADSVLGRPTRLCPAEEMIWSKAFVNGRDRFDGADVQHLIRARAEKLDWRRLRRRFAGHEAVLLAHLLLFGYVYPSERDRVPAEVIDELMTVIRSGGPTTGKVCRGTFLSNDQYLTDVNQWGYTDARLKPAGPLDAVAIASITPPPPGGH